MEEKKINKYLDIKKNFFQQIKTKLINDWNKPLLLLFMLPIVTTSIISLTMPQWLYWAISIVSTLSINFFIFSCLSSKYLNGIFQKEQLLIRCYRILLYLPIVMYEIKIVKELISISYKGKTIGEFLRILMLLIVCLILRSSYLVYYKQFRHYLKLYYLVVDIIVLTTITTILNSIQYIKKTIDSIEELLFLLVIVIGFFGYHFLINSFVTKTNLKDISTCMLNTKFKIKGYHLGRQQCELKLIPLDLYRPSAYNINNEDNQINLTIDVINDKINNLKKYIY